MEEIQLILHITLPVLAAMLLAARKAQGTGFKRIMDVFHLDASKGLLDQPLFHIGTLIPVFLFISFGSVAWKGYTVDLTAGGLDTFIKLSKLPLALLSLIVPIGAIISSFHSTKQTAVQIKITDRKANMELYHQHRSELFQYFDRLTEHNYLSALVGDFKIHPSIHKRMFIGSPEDGTPQPCFAAFFSIYQDLAEASVLLDKAFKGSHFKPEIECYVQACALLIKCAHQLELPVIYRDLAKQSYNLHGQKVRPLGDSAAKHIAALRYIADYLNALCDFCGGIEFAPLEFSDLMHSLPDDPTPSTLNTITIRNLLKHEDTLSKKASTSEAQ